MTFQELQQLLGARIRLCIEKAGYRTIEEFAFAFGIGKSTLSDVLTGKKSPTVSTLARWANALEIPIVEFFHDERLNAWIREAPPEYFQNRAKTPQNTKLAKAVKPAKSAKPAKSRKKRK